MRGKYEAIPRRAPGVVTYIHQDLTIVKRDSMQDICVKLLRTEKYSMMAMIALYINPSRNDKDAFIMRLMSYCDFLNTSYGGLKIVIFGDLNMRKFCLRQEVHPRLDLS